MFSVESPLISLYARLIGWVLTGFILGRLLPTQTSTYLGRFLFTFGTPLSIIAFIRKTNLSGQIAISPVVAWVAILVGAAFAWVWIDLGVTDERIKATTYGVESMAISKDPKQKAVNKEDRAPAETSWSKPTQGSFFLAMMMGNTAFLGYPIILSTVGAEYFGWALFFDLIGTTVAVNILGVAIAAHFGTAQQVKDWKTPVKAILRNPALWAFITGVLLRPIVLPPQVDEVLQNGAWVVITLFLIMIGLQLSKLTSLRNLQQGLTCLSIKMLFTPLVVGTGLMFFGLSGAPRLLMVLMMGMPPAFSTTLFAEAYSLDRDLAVTTVALGSVGILFTIPLWIILFGS